MINLILTIFEIIRNFQLKWWFRHEKNWRFLSLEIHDEIFMGGIDGGLDDEGVYNCQGNGSWSDVLVTLFEEADGDFRLAAL